MKKNLLLALVMCLFLLVVFCVTASAEDTYSLVVEHGTGGGSYTYRQTVTVRPDTPPAGQVFVRWDTDYKYLYNVNFYEETLSFRMPEDSFKLTAVFANPHEHAPCGDATCTDATHPAHTAHNFLPLEDINDLRLNAGDNYYHLSQDITLTYNVSAPSYISIGSGKTLYLCLHGYDIISVSSLDSIFQLSGTGKLVICDCKGADISTWGKIMHSTGSTSNDVGIKMNGSIDTADDPVLEMYGGNITGNNPNFSDSFRNNGAGIYADYGAAITMYNGAITNNKTNQLGGGVCVYNGSTFTMYDGTISGNTAYRGGGIYSDSVKQTTTAVTIHGGTICNNTATYGGGMYIARDYSNSAQDLLIVGGNIAQNKASSYGGGVYLDYSQATMSGGTVSGNELTYDYEDYGGGVYLYTSSRFNMNGGTIKDNKADYGAGVCVTSRCNGFFVSGSATIQSNKNSNVYLDSWDNADKCIQVTGPLTGTIGITTEHTPTATKPVRFLQSTDYTITENDLKRIVSDRTGTLYSIKNIDQENYGIFGYVQYKVNIAATENGTASANPTSAAAGKVVTLTAAPDTGHQFKEWQVVKGDVTVEDNKFTMGSADVEIKAIFEPASFNYTVETYMMDVNGQYGEPELTSDMAAFGTQVMLDPEALEGFTLDTAASTLSGDIKLDDPLVLKVYYSRNQYVLTCVVDGVETSATYYYGAPLTALTTPEKIGHTFTGWVPTIPATMPAESITSTAQWSINKYIIKFINENDSELQSSEVAYGELPIYEGNPPTKAATAQYTYTFTGWSPAITQVTSDATYTATYTTSINNYTVTWVNDDGQILATESVAYGGSITQAPAVPEKLGYTGQWSHDGSNILQSIVIRPEYTANQYTISFNSDGGSTVAPITQAYGSIVNAPAAPIRDGWIFQGWEPAIPATIPAENISLTALWTPKTILNSFSLSTEEIWLYSAETYQLNTTKLDPADAVCDFVWTSSDPSVLSVNSGGLLTASGAGTVVLTVTETWSGLSQRCTVHVVTAVTDISFAESALLLLPGDTEQLSATVACGNETFTNKLVTFTSSDESVATVDQSGVITAVSEGSVTITAAAANGVSATCTVKVQLLGDANRDGAANAYDVLLILQYSAGWNVTLDTDYADINRDGIVGISDALKILQDCMGGDLISAMRALQDMLANLESDSLKITSQPVDQYVSAGQKAVFTVSAAGDGLQYQWYINRNDGDGWIKLINSTEASCTASTAVPDDNGAMYHCEIIDIYGNTIISEAATLHVALDLPNTGDKFDPWLWFTLCTLSCFGLTVLKKKHTAALPFSYITG